MFKCFIYLCIFLYVWGFVLQNWKETFLKNTDEPFKNIHHPLDQNKIYLNIYYKKSNYSVYFYYLWYKKLEMNMKNPQGKSIPLEVIIYASFSCKITNIVSFRKIIKWVKFWHTWSRKKNSYINSIGNKKENVTKYLEDIKKIMWLLHSINIYQWPTLIYVYKINLSI